MIGIQMQYTKLVNLPHQTEILNPPETQCNLIQEPTKSSKQPIRTRYLGHVTGYQPIRDLNRSVPDLEAQGLLEGQRDEVVENEL